MAEFDWRDSYRIGDHTIDTEHKHLFALANKVIHFRASGEQLETVRRAVFELHAYIKTHFTNEEACMEQAGFPRLAAHKVLHGAIIHEMNEALRHSPGVDTVV